MDIELTVERGAAILTLNRPDKLNALSFSLLRELDEKLDQIELLGARSLIITGTGEKAFCAGADIEELRNRDLMTQRRGAQIGQAIFEKLARLSLVSVAAINGFALGGGLELALACTFRVANPAARLGLPEIKLGLIPGYGGTQRLARIVGETRALDLILSGRMVDAVEAERIGLVNRIAEGDALEGARALAATMSSYSLPALVFAREAVTRALDQPIAVGLQIEADLSTLAYRTQDAEEGLAAFAAKRRAVFIDA